MRSNLNRQNDANRETAGSKTAVSLVREALFFSIFIGGGVMIRFGVNLPNHPGGDACRDGVCLLYTSRCV